MDTPLIEPENDLKQIVQVAGQSIHGVADDRVTLADVPCYLFELGTVEVLAGGLSTNRLSSVRPSSWRNSFWSSELTRR